MAFYELTQQNAEDMYIYSILSGIKNLFSGKSSEKSAADKRTEQNGFILHSALDGTAVRIEKIEDDVFSAGVLGPGIAVEPVNGEIHAPCDGVISNTTDTRHAVGITASNGAEILIHVGLDTVKLGGKFFEYKIKEGEKVKKGDILLTFDVKAIRDAGYKTITPMVICNSDDFSEIRILSEGPVKTGDNILELKK